MFMEAKMHAGKHTMSIIQLPSKETPKAVKKFRKVEK
jgi:hypothetical protein